MSFCLVIHLMVDLTKCLTLRLTPLLSHAIRKWRRAFVHQAKYMKDLIKKFVMTDAKPLSTPMSTTTTLDPDEDGEAVDQRKYRSLIDFLLYLMVTRSDIQFTMCLCVCFQASPCTLHCQAVQ
jgi:hypothetical protein